ncbi:MULTISPECIES: hypothetical protein [unclassified Rhizobium]|uniref:COG3904 family protein n=1 Tax=unclassified Rhizobium TaxID=2613769 RepID=UPI000EA8DD01|nr:MULTISPECIES: hypothetical protein [unclassified Rhizobium]AYG66900.1 hypothetical protein CCGE531_13500 [Rhizobium sp. CCGE531]AYG73280.1 hypothetical protein CCGE532_12920 [Rhizobium sp. CCGE532]
MNFRFFPRLAVRCCRTALWFVTAVSLLLVAPAFAEAAGVAGGTPMRFLLVHGEMGQCRADNACPDWISAEGQIMSDTPRKLQKFLKQLGNRQLPIVVSSPGGDVKAAMEMARTVRKQKLSIAVGRTRSRACPYAEPICPAALAEDGSIKGQAFSAGAICFSACPLFFAGGVQRVSSPFALLGVHQITTTYSEVRVQYRTEYEMVDGKRKVLSKKEIGRKFVGKYDTTKLDKAQRTRLARFLDKMGVDKGLVDVMLGTEPSGIHLMSQMEALRLKLTTELADADALVSARNCKDGQSISDCAAPPPPMTNASAMAGK